MHRCDDDLSIDFILKELNEEAEDRPNNQKESRWCSEFTCNVLLSTRLFVNLFPTFDEFTGSSPEKVDLPGTDTELTASITEEIYYDACQNSFAQCSVPSTDDCQLAYSDAFKDVEASLWDSIESSEYFLFIDFY